ncbi:SGNH/GDSL hydrolase family protein [Mycobacterium sp. C31M]
MARCILGLAAAVAILAGCGGTPADPPASTTSAAAPASAQDTPQLPRWSAAVADADVRNPRLLVVGDSASSAGYSWQHQLAGHRYFSPQQSSVADSALDTQFVNTLSPGQETRFNELGHITDIDLLIAPDSPAVGEYRYDEGPWKPWATGDVWSDMYPESAPVNSFRIDDMNGAKALTVRNLGAGGSVEWYGFTAQVSDRKLDVMSLAANGVTSQWWADLITGPTDTADGRATAAPRALAAGFNPDLIVIALGANDLDDATLIDDVDDNLVRLIETWRSLLPNADIALQTYWQPNWSPVREQVLATAAAQNVALLDWWPSISPRSASPSQFHDEYHMNEEGHRALAQIAARELDIERLTQ